MHFEIIVGSSLLHHFVESITPQKGYVMTLDLSRYSLPTLMQGDDDSKAAGYNYVHRVQMLLNFTVGAQLIVDGVYGPATTTAVKSLATDSNGKTVGINEWAQIYGLSKAATS
jgi:peptidoglycan hydrolase-like protein with peptidoglycan-binding domain